MSISYLSAVLTGVFCVVFALVVNAVAGALEMWLFLMASFVSGFLGNLFAQTVLRRR